MHFVFPDIVTILLRKPDIPFISDYHQGFLAHASADASVDRAGDDGSVSPDDAKLYKLYYGCIMVL